MEALDLKKRRRSLRLRRQSGKQFQCIIEDVLCIPVNHAHSDDFGSEWAESPKSDAIADKRKKRRSSRIHHLPVFSSIVSAAETENSMSPERLCTRDASSPDHIFKNDSPSSCFNCNAQSPAETINVKSPMLNFFQLSTPEFTQIKTPDKNIEIVQTPTTRTSENEELYKTPELDQNVCVNEKFITHRNSKHDKYASTPTSFLDLFVDSSLLRKISSPFADNIPYSPSQPMNLLGSPFSCGSHDSSICQDSPEKIDSELSTVKCLMDSEEIFHTPCGGRSENRKITAEHDGSICQHTGDNTEDACATVDADSLENQGNQNGQDLVDSSKNLQTIHALFTKDVNSNIREKIWMLTDIEKEFSGEIRAFESSYDSKHEDIAVPIIHEQMTGEVEDLKNSIEVQASSNSLKSQETFIEAEQQENCRRSTRVRRKSLETFQVTLNYENSRCKKKEKHDLLIPVEDIYLNKHFVRPHNKTWQTIFEMPVKGKSLSLKKFRRSILFENLTPTRLKQRQKRVKLLGVRKRKTLDDEFVLQKIASLDKELMSE